MHKVSETYICRCGGIYKGISYSILTNVHSYYAFYAYLCLYVPSKTENNKYVVTAHLNPSKFLEWIDENR